MHILKCEGHNHEELIKKVMDEMPTDEVLTGLSDLFKIFGDATRMKILFAL